MSTYNTYQEARISMPLACIIHDTDNDSFFGMPTKAGTTLNPHGGCKFAEPADYCMTLEKFLADGHKLVKGDVIFDSAYGNVINLLGLKVHDYNRVEELSYKRYILLAAALEESKQEDKPRTKIKRIQVNSVFEVEQNEFITDAYVFKDKDEFRPVSSERVLIDSLNKCNLYREIETPIEWWDDAVNHAQQCKQVNTAVYLPESDSIDIDGSMTRDEACDFARILLEQGE